MLETLLTSRRKSVKDGLLLDIDFIDAPLGAKTLIDKAQGIVFTLQGAANSVNTNFGVVDHPTAGRCFQFNGINWFYNATNVLNNFSSGEYDIELSFIKPATGLAIPFTSGTYVDSGNGDLAGLTVVLDQFAYSYIELFISTISGAYARFQPSAVNPRTLETIVFQKRKTGTTFKNLGTGVTFNGGIVISPEHDRHLCIGGDLRNQYTLNGYLKHLRIRKITT